MWSSGAQPSSWTTTRMPAIILDYNHNKGGMDNLGKMFSLLIKKQAHIKLKSHTCTWIKSLRITHNEVWDLFPLWSSWDKMARQDQTQYGSEIIKQKHRSKTSHHSSYIIGIIHMGTEDIKHICTLFFKAAQRGCCCFYRQRQLIPFWGSSIQESTFPSITTTCIITTCISTHQQHLIWCCDCVHP